MYKLVLLLLFINSILFSEIISFHGQRTLESTVRTKSEGLFSTTLDLTIPAIGIFPEKMNGEEYQYIRVKNLSSSHDVGKPTLPIYNFAMVVPEKAEFKFEILEEEFVYLNDINVAPAQTPYEDSKESEHDIFKVTQKYNEDAKFEKDYDIYAEDTLMPKSIVSLDGIEIYRKSSIAYVKLSPVQYNPVTKKLKVYTRLKVSIEFNGGICRSALKNQSKKLINRVALNGHQYTRAVNKRVDDSLDDILIVTTPKFIKPVNELVQWQKQKGYDVKVESKSSWTVSSVMSTVKDFYDDNMGEYLLIVGDFEDVPADSFDYRTWTDLNYVMFEGASDRLPDMANGRIAVSTEEEAWTVINKILKYEKDPIPDDAFYKNQLVCSQFQDLNKNDTADHRFTLTAWEMKTYVEGKGYTCTHLTDVYDDEENPMYWDDGRWSFGGKIPQYLQRPYCSWDDNAEDIIREIEEGKFLVMHRDHGNIDRWAWPRFTVDDIYTLENGDKTPVVFSLNCLTGRFKSDTCLAEAFIRRQGGGAVGVVAACRESYSGWNDAFCHGLYDAIWPGTSISSPKVLNPDVPEHEPIYTMGDVVINGTIHQNAGWSFLQDAVRLFHYFGDPTMEIRTSKPKTFSADFSSTVKTSDLKYSVTGLNVNSGTATLYNKRTKMLIGKTSISGSTISIPVTAKSSYGDTVILTITSHDYIPIIEDLPVIIGQTNKGLLTNVSYKPTNISINGKAFSINGNRNVSLKIYSANGQEIFFQKWQLIDKDVMLQIPNFATGLYFVRIKNSRSVSIQNMLHIKK